MVRGHVTLHKLKKRRRKAEGRVRLAKACSKEEGLAQQLQVFRCEAQLQHLLREVEGRIGLPTSHSESYLLPNPDPYLLREGEGRIGLPNVTYRVICDHSITQLVGCLRVCQRAVHGGIDRARLRV